MHKNWINLQLSNIHVLHDLVSQGNTIVVFADMDSSVTRNLTDEILCLSEEELVRFDRFKNARVAEYFSRSHRLKRIILGGILGQHPCDISFSNTTNGKPYLTNGTQACKFNYSHSDHFFSMAVSSREVGIDIESFPGNKSDCMNVAKRYFSHTDIETLHRIQNQAQQTQVFFLIWNKYESFSKLFGLKLSDILGKDLKSLADDVHIIPFNFPEKYLNELQGGTGAIAYQAAKEHEIIYINFS